MSDPDNPNPYQTPTTKSESRQTSEKIESSYTSVVWLFLVPFLLAHLVYWPVFLIGLASFGDYGITGLFMGAGAVLIAGASYGSWLGLNVRAESLGTPSLNPALYALGQMLWFAFSVFAPCGIFFLGA